VNLAGRAANCVFQADWGRFQGAIEVFDVLEVAIHIQAGNNVAPTRKRSAQFHIE
jgi:hypothetical protein